MCHDDSCELVHCKKCRCHTAGNELMAGLCQECFEIQEDEDRQEWLQQQKQQLEMTVHRHASVIADINAGRIIDHGDTVGLVFSANGNWCCCLDCQAWKSSEAGIASFP